MNNTRFATAIHILILLGKNPNEWISSEWIAGSIGVNPVIVRKEIGVLKEFGLVDSRKGKDGGCKLSRGMDKILLSEIYIAVKNSELLGKKNRNPNPDCPIGKSINQTLDVLFKETDRVVFDFLSRKTLEEVSMQFI